MNRVSDVTGAFVSDLPIDGFLFADVATSKTLERESIHDQLFGELVLLPVCGDFAAFERREKNEIENR